MIEKRRAYDAYKAVKSNKGATGVDEQTIEQFEADLRGNLYKIWNRMSSGSYSPPPVRTGLHSEEDWTRTDFGCAHVSDEIREIDLHQLGTHIRRVHRCALNPRGD